MHYVSKLNSRVHIGNAVVSDAYSEFGYFRQAHRCSLLGSDMGNFDAYYALETIQEGGESLRTLSSISLPFDAKGIS